MSGPEIHADAIQTALEGFPLRSIGTSLERHPDHLPGLVVPLASLRMQAVHRGRAPGRSSRYFITGRSDPRVPDGAMIVLRVPARGPSSHRRRDRDPLHRHGVREGARPRRLLALRAGGGRRPGARRIRRASSASAASWSSGRRCSPTCAASRPFPRACRRQVIGLLNRYLTRSARRCSRTAARSSAYMGDGI